MNDFVETRQLATTLGSLSTDTSNLAGNRKGQIVSIEDGTCTITLSGDPTEIPGIAYLDSYTPVEDQTVIVAKQGGSLLIVGTTDHTGGGGDPDPGGYIPAPTLSLVRSTSLSVSNTTATTIPWSSQVANIQGPSTWWASGTPGSIVMPWIGLYRVNVNVCWDTNSANYRTVWFVKSTTLSTPNFVAGASVQLFSADEASNHTDLAFVLNNDTVDQVYVVAVQQNSGGTRTIQAKNAQPPAMCTITYLGEL